VKFSAGKVTRLELRYAASRILVRSSCILFADSRPRVITCVAQALANRARGLAEEPAACLRRLLDAIQTQMWLPPSTRFVQSAKRECLDHVVVFGEAHLRHILSEFLAYYHRSRPHQGLGNRPPGWEEDSATGGELPPGEVVCEERLGGLLKHYRRAA
jgi:Integrase core domain